MSNIKDKRRISRVQCIECHEIELRIETLRGRRNLASRTIDGPFTSTFLASFGKRKSCSCSEGDIGFTFIFVWWRYEKSMGRGREWEREDAVNTVRAAKPGPPSPSFHLAFRLAILNSKPFSPPLSQLSTLSTYHRLL